LKPMGNAAAFKNNPSATESRPLLASICGTDRENESPEGSGHSSTATGGADKGFRLRYPRPVARRGNAAMSDPREELLRQMAALRKSLDPKVIERLDLATEGKVPYDRETAQSAVRQFLATRHDGGKFQKKLVEALKKGGGKP
jgi:hypothetical protein